MTIEELKADITYHEERTVRMRMLGFPKVEIEASKTKVQELEAELAELKQLEEDRAEVARW